MIYTLTLNPSLDYVLDLPRFTPGRVNRAGRAALFPGGKGLNVSIMLGRLGVPSRALGFAAGPEGERLRQLVRAQGVDEKLLALPSGSTRINVKLRAGQETDINAPGPEIPSQALEQLLARLDSLSQGDVLVLAGSIPPGLPPSFYGDVLHRLQGRGVRGVVDAQGEALRQALPQRPFLIKPNRAELEELAGRPLQDARRVQQAAQALQRQGAENVLVSLGGEGALLLDSLGRVHTAPAPKGEVKGAVGAGDSMVAGFLAGLLAGEQPAAESRGDKGRAPDHIDSISRAFRMGLAAGSATTFSDWLASGAEVLQLMGEGAANLG